MPPGVDTEPKKLSGKTYRLILSVAVFLSVLMFSCSGSDKNEHLEEQHTQAQPVVSPIISQSESISKGNDLFLKGNFKDAIEFYTQGIAQNRSVAFYNIGVSYYLLGDIKKSEEAFRKSVKENPMFKEAFMNLAVVLIQLGKLSEAEVYVSELLKEEYSAKMLVNMANIHLKRGETAKASTLFEEAVSRERNSKYVLSNYAYFLMSIGDFKKGIEIIESLQFKDYTDYYNLSSAYFNIGMYKASLQAVEKALGFEKTEDALSLAAHCYHNLGDFFNEVKSLNAIVAMNPDRSYRFRLANALYLDGRTSNARNEITDLIKQYPNTSDYYRLKYEVEIALGNIREAGELAVDAYKRFKTDNMLYVVVKHKIIYHEDLSAAQEILAKKRTSPYLELARTAYYIAKDELIKAQKSLLKVPAETDNDYYIYRSNILLRYGEYENALAFAGSIDKVKPESFWYKVAVHFNTGNIAGLKDVLSEQVVRKTNFSRNLKVAFHLKPMMKDIHFSYRFEGTYEDILTAILYPLFIDPDEMMNFVALGYKMLQENQKLIALEELEKSVNFSEGVKANNEGVAKMFSYQFEEAFEIFEQANIKLNNNPYTLYNMGLAKLNMGALNEAAKYFDTAILQNNFLFPAHLGLAICFNEKGERRKAMEYYNLVRDRVIQVIDSNRKLPRPILYSGFFAEMGFRGYRKVIDDIGESKDDNSLLKGIVSIAEYLSGQGFSSLDPLAEPNSIFRGKALRDLIGTLEGEIVSYDNSLVEDRLYRFMKAYALLKKGVGEPNIKPEEYPGDKTVLKELVYYNIIAGRKEKALDYLQSLSKLDIKYKELYKASLYYFLWIEDFVNAEASYNSLRFLNYTDRYVEYYKLLYFILNYNSKRIVDNIKSFMKTYPDDFRGRAIRMLYSLREEDFEIALNAINDIEKDEGNFIEKLPLEIGIDGL
jgi:tetratricopeptide (TPR) repeat protein